MPASSAKTRKAVIDVVLQWDMTQRRSGPPRAAQEHPLGDAGQIILSIAFVAIWILDTFVFRLATWLNGIVPLALRLTLGVINLGGALYLAWASHRLVFSRERETTSLIRTGVYGIARHPMYLSVAMFFLGILCMSLSLAAGLLWVTLIFFLNNIARFEERQLLSVFGDDYRAYMSDVSRWGIRLWPFR